MIELDHRCRLFYVNHVTYLSRIHNIWPSVRLYRGYGWPQLGEPVQSHRAGAHRKSAVAWKNSRQWRWCAGEVELLKITKGMNCGDGAFGKTQANTRGRNRHTWCEQNYYGGFHSLNVRVFDELTEKELLCGTSCVKIFPKSAKIC